MEFSEAELTEALRQLDSLLRKLREAIRTPEGRERPERYRSQLTLARRRVRALEISAHLIRRELSGR